jgi:hypothetical protein
MTGRGAAMKQEREAEQDMSEKKQCIADIRTCAMVYET